jgi:response regulator RpfG family c-di-GMP phosphodiesterase
MAEMDKDTKKLNALIIDDDQSITEIISDIISPIYPLIDVAHNVDDAIFFTNQCTYDLIILDINLDGRNGAEVIKSIISNDEHANKESKLVIISGMINQQFKEKNQHRFADIILKPFNHDQFYDRIYQLAYPSGIAKEQMTDRLKEKSHNLPEVACVLPFTVPQLQAKVTNILDQINKNSRVRDLFKNLKMNHSNESYSNKHIGLIINISSAISIEFSWNTDKTLEKFVYAAYLHNMSLQNKDNLLHINDFNQLEKMKTELSSQDYQLVYQHPNIAADIIQEIDEIPSDVAQIVRQHHESPKENGFPNKVGTSKISPLSSIFIVSHDLAERIIQSNEWNTNELDRFLKDFKLRYRGVHFHKVQQALIDLKKRIA